MPSSSVCDSSPTISSIAYEVWFVVSKEEGVTDTMDFDGGAAAESWSGL